MIETALALAANPPRKELVAEIIAAGQGLIRHRIELLPRVQETLGMLASCYRLILITRGDLFDQERKLAGSGLEPFFHAIEIVSDKNAATYGRVFSRYGDGPERAMTVGNSLRSDVIPAPSKLEAGVFMCRRRANGLSSALPRRWTRRGSEASVISANCQRFWRRCAGFDARFDRAWGKKLRQARRKCTADVQPRLRLSSAARRKAAERPRCRPGGWVRSPSEELIRASSTAMTKTDADCLRLLPNRRLGPFHRLRDLHHRRSCFRNEL